VKYPAISFVAIATLALGIGASAAIFSVVGAVLLRPVHDIRPAQIVNMSENESKPGISDVRMPWPAFTLLHDHYRSFSAITGLRIK
jgi:hypothetical protein